MFGGRKQTKPRASSGKNLSQFGLFDVPDINNMDVDENDSDLEAELAALAGNSGVSKPKRRAKAVPKADLDSMVAASMKDIGSDEELSGDDDDPDLLNELNEIAGGDASEEDEPASEQSESPAKSTASTDDVKGVLQQRMEMYVIAEQNAKTAGETSKVRRYGRAIKTLKDLIKQANAGKAIDQESIPPEVSLKKPTSEGDTTLPEPTRTAPPIPTRPTPLDSPSEAPSDSVTDTGGSNDTTSQQSEETVAMLNLLNERKQQYKVAALNAKKSGDTQTALKYIKYVKQFDQVITAVSNGQPVDLSKMPGPPEESNAPQEPKVEESETQKTAVPELPVPEEELPEPELITASSVLEALEQRLELYKKQESLAKEQNNSSKARRMGRVCKQFEQAIKLHKAGKPIPVDELPTPPGYAPIPVDGATPSAVKPAPAATPQPPSTNNVPTPKKPTPPTSEGSARLSGNHIQTSRAEKQLTDLLQRQKEFKLAALNAKKKGEMNEAKEFLRQAKGFDRVIEAARCGLPVDFSTLPLSPTAKSHLDEEFDLVMAEECDENNDGDMDIISRLEAQLTKQMKLCLSNRDHNKALGDVAGANRFERMALNVTKDLDVVRLAHRTPGAGIPKFHYENKEFSIVKSFTELNDNDLELSILKGINYNCKDPKNIDTYVKYEFPYPQDAHYIDKTYVIKDTNNPDYNTTVIIPINRTARTCQRVFKRHSIKLEVYSKGGFFRSDTLIGTASVKLAPLETQCEIHDSFDLMEGRKKVGGKLEVRVRIRQPIATQQVEQLHEKWLVIDS